MVDNTHRLNVNPKLPLSMSSLSLPELELPSDLHLRAGVSRSSAFCMLAERGARVWNNGQYHFNQIHEEGFSLGLQLNNLLLRLIRAPGQNTTVHAIAKPRMNFITMPWYVKSENSCVPLELKSPEPNKVVNHTYKNFQEFYRLSAEVNTFAITS